MGLQHPQILKVWEPPFQAWGYSRSLCATLTPWQDTWNQRMVLWLPLLQGHLLIGDPPHCTQGERKISLYFINIWPSIDIIQHIAVRVLGGRNRSVLKAVENLTFSSNSCFSYVQNTKILTLPNLEEIKLWNSKTGQIVMIHLFSPFPKNTDLVPLKSSTKNRSQGFDSPLPHPKSTFTTQEPPLDEQTFSSTEQFK